MVKIECVVCNKRCKGTVLKIGEYHLHKKCFNCKICGISLDVGSFQLREKQFFCPEDFQMEFSIKCGGCGKPVEGDVVTALNKTFHTFCLRCFSCNKTISGGEKTVGRNDHFYCVRCAPPQLPLEEEDVEGFQERGSTIRREENGHDYATLATESLRETSPNHTPPPCTTNGKTKSSTMRKSFSIPRRMGGFLRSKKAKSQTFQAEDKQDDFPQRPRQLKATNGTGVLSIHVGDPDITSADAETSKRIEIQQSPAFSLYSGDESGLCKTREASATMPGTTGGNYPMAPSVGGTGGVAYSIDPAFTTPSMIHTLSEDTSTLLYGSVKRICPPGVDYGRQYLVSYLHLAEQGLTAATGADDLHADATMPANLASLRHMRPPSSGPASQRLSRRDNLQFLQKQQTRTLPISMETATSSQPTSYVDRRYAPQVFGEAAGGRPERDRYTRYRQLSPASSSVGRAISSGRGTMPGANFVSMKPQTYSSYSTPNVNIRRGIRVLADSMLRSPRIGRSMSPEAALEAQAEARRLAAYPGARVPDANSEPVIDRYDWPAPPSPAVVMIDRRRERAMRSGTLTDETLLRSNASGSDSRTLSPGRSHSMSPLEAEGPSMQLIGRQADKVATLKRATGNSGMSAAVTQYLELENDQRDGSPNLDPISASRSPNASVEPPYSTRYANHRFAFPRPGYTAGILTSRPGSLPRAVNGTLPSQDWSIASPLSPAQRKLYTHAGTARTLPVNGPRGMADHEGFFSSTTSGLSMEGFASRVGNGEPINDTPSSYRSRSTTLTGGLPPPSISGLRPIGRSSNYGYTGATRSRNTTASSSLRNGGRNLRTLSEGARNIDSPLREVPNGEGRLEDDAFPHVQNWLKPAKPQETTTYPYEHLKLSSEGGLKGVDGNHREDYLSSDEFQHLFQMSRSAFRLLPEWKKNDLKRRLDLY